jgi:hypothetical protein
MIDSSAVINPDNGASQIRTEPCCNGVAISLFAEVEVGCRSRRSCGAQKSQGPGCLRHTFNWIGPIDHTEDVVL